MKTQRTIFPHFSVVVVASIVIVLLGAVRGWGDDPQSQLEPHATMTFFVASAGREHQMLRGVEVLGLKLEGAPIRFGVTDQFGSLAVRKSDLQESASGAVLFCREGFFCGAFRLDEARFFAYDEKYIQLAPFAVR